MSFFSKLKKALKPNPFTGGPNPAKLVQVTSGVDKKLLKGSFSADTLAVKNTFHLSQVADRFALHNALKGPGSVHDTAYSSGSHATTAPPIRNAHAIPSVINPLAGIRSATARMFNFNAKIR